MIAYDVATNILFLIGILGIFNWKLDTEIFLQHTIADLNLWHCIYCLVQSREVFTVKRNKHAHTHTHTHTHTYTHIHILQYANTGPIQRSFQNFFSIILFLLTQVRWFCCFRSGSHICYKHARHNHLRGPIELQHNWHNHLLRRKYNDIGLHYKSNWITFLVTISSTFHLYYLFEC